MEERGFCMRLMTVFWKPKCHLKINKSDATPRILLILKQLINKQQRGSGSINQLTDMGPQKAS